MKVIQLYKNEKELIKRAALNNNDAQRSLFKQYSPKMLSVCRQYITDIHYAEDAMISGFFKAFKHIGNFNFEGSFEGWIRKIMVRECLSFLRAKKDFVFVEEIVAIEDNLTIENSLSFEVDELQKLIDELPRGYRAVFVMYGIEGYSHKEIATLLKISEGTSKSQLFKARKMLKENLMKQKNCRMALNNFEKQIKEKFSHRTIEPSNDAWAKLETKLVAKKSQYNFKNLYWIVAAVFIGVVVVNIVKTTNSNVDTTLPVIVNEEKNQNSNQQKEEINNNRKEPALVFDKEKVNVDKELQEKTAVVTLKEIENTENTFETVVNENKKGSIVKVRQKENKLIDLKVNEVLLSISELNEKSGSVTDAEIDELLLKAQKEISTQRILESNRVDATALLLDVEGELDKSFRDKVFKAIKNGYLKVKTAVAERNQ